MKHALTSQSIFLIFSYSSNPLICGILTSSSSRSYMPGLKFDRANTGSSKASTTKPFASNPVLKVKIMSGSSSTRSILLLLEEFFCSTLLASSSFGCKQIHVWKHGWSILSLWQPVRWSNLTYDWKLMWAAHQLFHPLILAFLLSYCLIKIPFYVLN